MRKEEQQRKKRWTKKKGKNKGKKSTVLVSTEDTENDRENCECAACGGDGKAIDYDVYNRCERWFRFTYTQLGNKTADFVCDFCRWFYLSSIPGNICLIKINDRNFKTCCENWWNLIVCLYH